MTPLIPVAILGDGVFDVNDVDVNTAAFGPNGAMPVHSGHVEDVNDDGYMDLVLHFNTQDTGISEGDTEAMLTGQLASGQSLEGSDSVRIVPGSKKGKAGKVVAAGMQSTSWGQIKKQLQE